MKRHIVRFALGFVVLLLLLGHAARVYQLGFINRLDAIIYDTKVRLTMPQGVDERIAILDIDEKSLGELGRWPWGRDRMSQLVKKLFDQHGIVILGFDVVFAEPDDSSGLKVLEGLAKSELKDVAQYQSALRALLPQLDHDGRFAETLKGRPVILGYYFSGRSGGVSSGAIPPPVLPEGSFTGRNIPFTVWAHYGGNLEQFQKAALSGGHFNPLVDFDGISRRVPLLAEYQGAYYEALSLAMVRALLGQPKVAPWYPEAGWFSSKSYQGMEAIDLPTTRGTLRIPVDDNVSALIPYRGYQGSYRYYSISDIMADRLKPGELKGKIALIGTTAPGLLDLRATPVGEAYPGVEIHANLISGMLDGAIKQKPSYVLGAEVVILLLSGLVMVFLLPLLNPLRATLASLLVLLFVVTVNLFFWHYGNLVLPLGTGLLMVLALFALNMSYGYFVESRTKRQFTDLFGQYVPPELVEEMSRNPESYSMDGRKEELTVLFSDVRGFTTISEGLTPDELTRLMNEYLSAMTEVIRKNRGTLDKYIGDAIMALWGAPVADPQHAKHAVLTAMAMQQALPAVNKAFAAKGWPEIRIGVGVNTGDMTVGDMGSAVRKAYTVMGDAVNLGSRLEGITKQYGVGILVGEGTRKAIKDLVFREVDRVQVKGKEEPVAIYEPIGLEGEVPKAVLDELKLWNQALRHYRSQEWDQAEVALLNLSRLAPERALYGKYMERVAQLRKAPPEPEWQGVWKFETK
ncbi:MAG: guanylate cyclase [Rhodocyclaceae bacterium]|uniref:Adenylate/guanylate cyclase domain-containing protein n=1 Tax=Candidatus Desulfobacillus denitrificans TaxID=2608985 RepID=A0A809R4L6_9PROT|nr:adenylate/guanylate cyclase domain-containing protein [Candidatus Desulfobacillus denitrificans]GIK47133.1 MAG: guanylate cyclase [Betaproteobacteria bacterium]GJQ56019.1 MAG: guanylate cyclase [Rhodocyclaceae bacterium]